MQVLLSCGNFKIVIIYIKITFNLNKNNDYHIL